MNLRISHDSYPLGKVADEESLSSASLPHIGPEDRLLIATDVWEPSINGVTRSLQEIQTELESREQNVRVLHPSRFISNPLYPDVPIPRVSRREIANIIEEFAPNFIHVATEGPVGLHVRGHCLKHGYEFSSSFHTLWPDYAKQWMGIPKSISWKLLRQFHNAASVTMTRTESMKEELLRQGFQKVELWHGSVDTTRFFPREKQISDEKRPILLYVGRVSSEKNLEAFLDLPTRMGTKIVVGDGPSRKDLEQRYPAVDFVGAKRGEELAQLFSEGDCFVFPSKTDTFGRVMIEAMACGVPVAAYPVTGPTDIVTAPELGALSDDLSAAVELALERGVATECVNHAQNFSLPKVTDQFLSNLVRLR